MRPKRWNFSQVCIAAGVVLISLSVLLLVFWQVSARQNAEASRNYVGTIAQLIPEPQAAVMEPRMDNTMPSLNIGKHDFVAVMEMPTHGASFPVGASWGNHRAYPCRYGGSVYDGSLVIGSTTQQGQLDFAKEISVGHPIQITDMCGNCFSFEVSDIRISKQVDKDLLQNAAYDLTIFIQNIYSFEYIVIYCHASGT